MDHAAGCLLLTGLFFVKDDDVQPPAYYLSLGFMKWGTQAIPCRLTRWGEDASWQQLSSLLLLVPSCFLSCPSTMWLGPGQEYIVPDPGTVQQPTWIFLDSVALGSCYKALPTKITPSGAVKGSLPKSCIFFQVCGEPTDLLSYNVQQGIALTMSQMRSCMSARGIAIPKKGTGKNRVKHQDLALALVKALFPEAEGPDLQMMVSSLGGRKTVIAPELLLSLVANLETKEAEQFSKLKKSAASELERRAEAKEKEFRALQKLPRAQNEAAARGHDGPEERPPRPAAHPEPGIRGPVAAHAKVRAPELVKNLLPPGITNCYLNVRLQQRNCSVAFNSILPAV